MPAFEYEDLDYHKEFSLTPTAFDHDKINVKCPKGGNRKKEQPYAAFYPCDVKEKVRFKIL